MRLRREARLRAELALLDAVDPPRLRVASDVMRDLRRLARQLVGLHDEPLVSGGHDRTRAPMTATYADDDAHADGHEPAAHARSRR